MSSKFQLLMMMLSLGICYEAPSYPEVPHDADEFISSGDETFEENSDNEEQGGVTMLEKVVRMRALLKKFYGIPRSRSEEMLIEMEDFEPDF